jgi:hypothetical protein
MGLHPLVQRQLIVDLSDDVSSQCVTGSPAERYRWRVSMIRHKVEIIVTPSIVSPHTVDLTDAFIHRSKDTEGSGIVWPHLVSYLVVAVVVGIYGRYAAVKI